MKLALILLCSLTLEAQPVAAPSSRATARTCDPSWERVMRSRPAAAERCSCGAKRSADRGSMSDCSTRARASYRRSRSFRWRTKARRPTRRPFRSTAETFLVIWVERYGGGFEKICGARRRRERHSDRHGADVRLRAGHVGRSRRPMIAWDGAGWHVWGGTRVMTILPNGERIPDSNPWPEAQAVSMDHERPRNSDVENDATLEGLFSVPLPALRRFVGRRLDRRRSERKGRDRRRVAQGRRRAAESVEHRPGGR